LLSTRQLRSKHDLVCACALQYNRAQLQDEESLRRSRLGCGCLDGYTDGLTDLGRSAVAKMNEIGVAIDFSHSKHKDDRGRHRGVEETGVDHSRWLSRCLHASAEQGRS
jgi:hypothetical protein